MNAPTLIVAASVAIVLFALSCGQSRQDDSNSIYHDIRSPVEFLASIGGKVSAPYPNEEEEKTIDEASAEAIVAALRERGPESLSQEDWQTLASVSWAALISQQESVRYLFTGDDPSGGQVQIIVEEKYKIPTSQGVEVPLIAGWRVQPMTPQSDAGETMLLFDLSDLEGEELLATTWQCSDGECECTTEDMSEGYIWWELLHFGRVVRIGSFRGVETIEGRPAYAFDAPTDVEGAGLIGEGLRLWLDVETLLPRQFEVLPSPAIMDSGGPNFFKFSGRYAILEVNGQIDMEPPGECVETYDEPRGDELEFECPEGSSTPGIEEVEVFAELMEAMKSTPAPGEMPYANVESALSELPRPTAEPGTLATLLPPDPFADSAIPRSSVNTNEGVGCPGCGYWTNEYELNLMGRLCGLKSDIGGWAPPVSSGDTIYLDVGTVYIELDYYATTPGAIEAFQRETSGNALQGDSVDSGDNESLHSLGDDRSLTLSVPHSGGTQSEPNAYELLFRRRNIIARMHGAYFSGASEEGPDAILEYAAQLDRNIEAAAQQQSR